MLFCHLTSMWNQSCNLLRFAFYPGRDFTIEGRMGEQATRMEWILQSRIIAITNRRMIITFCRQSLDRVHDLSEIATPHQPATFPTRILVRTRLFRPGRGRAWSRVPVLKRYTGI
jgi:hypothetical protein